ncbi:amidase [Paraburkholderia bannensis]|uniref:amidase n=1 Tax=Paraburkholderia bannensis TaxID=765414 RepID=UPI002AB66EE7|nr:amidase [Paraburkholderia bannensis]
MHNLSISELSTALRTRQLSPLEVTRHLLERIEGDCASLGAFVTVTADRAQSQARAAEQEIMTGHWRGVLHGVPLAFKDIFFSDFAPTTAGSLIHQHFVPNHSATAIRRLEAAGAVTLGKLKTTEHAFAEHHPTVTAPINPWDERAWTGVSSSGSGVATAAGLAYGTLGSDTGGSIRFPAAANGVTGLKPTWGRVSRYGVFELASTLDHVGPLARSATDCAILMNAIAGPDANDPTALHDAVPDYEAATRAPVGGLRIGLPRAYACDGVDPVVVNVWERAASTMADLGATMVDVDFPEWREVTSRWTTLCSTETAVAHANTFPSRSSEYGPLLASLIEKGRGESALELVRAVQLRHSFANQLHKAFRNIDVMLIPVTVWPIPTVEEWTVLARAPFTDLVRFTVPFNLAGNPALTLPAGMDDRQIPLSIQFVGPLLGEEAILRAGSAFQRCTNWHMRRPNGAVSAGHSVATSFDSGEAVGFRFTT